MKAIIETGGKQYYVTDNSVIYIEKLDKEAGSKVTFDKVLMVDGKIGTPYVKGIKVEGKVISHGKGKKIIVFKMKAKKNYRRKQGHRQPYTKVEITSIKTATAKKETTTKSEEKVTTKATETKTTAKKETAAKSAEKTTAATKTTKKEEA